MFRQYAIKLYGTLAVCFVLVTLLNVIVDPYALFHKKVWVGFNEQKPALVNNLRAFHIRQLQNIKPQALILGSSRAQLGLNAKHSGFQYPAYNLGMPLATIDEIADYFTYATQLTQVKQVVIAIDFFAFNVYLKSLSPFKTKEKIDAFEKNDRISALIGYSGLKGSVDTIIYNRRYLKNSQAIETHPGFESTQSKVKTLFDKSERFYLERKIYKPYPFNAYSLFHQQKGTSSLDHYQTILTTCQQYEMDCHIVILPVHARQLELMYHLGLWQQFEDWKREIVAKTSQISDKISVYDFTGYEKVHTELVPDLNATIQKMQYFIDSAHMTPQLGDEILNWVLLARPMKENIGIKLTQDNIQSHLTKIRATRQVYINENPQVAIEMTQKILSKA